MAMKEYFKCSKIGDSSLTIRLFRVISSTLVREVSYPSVEMQSVYSSAPAVYEFIVILKLHNFKKSDNQNT